MSTRILLGSMVFLAACGGPDSALYPLREGQTWEYQVERGAISGRIARTNLAQRDLKGRKVTPQKFGESQFTFVGSDDTGVYEYARQSAGALEPEILQTPRYYLKYPVKAGASWGGSTEAWLLISMPWTLSVKTTVEAVEDTVTVPAGTFQKCVKTKTTGEGKPPVNWDRIIVEEYVWFCPGVGIVKVVRKEATNLAAVRSEVSMALMAHKK